MIIKELLLFILNEIVDHKKELSIEEEKIAENSFQFLIKSNQEDIGKIIGKQGKIIQAIRNIVKILAIKQNAQIKIEVA